MSWGVQKSNVGEAQAKKKASPGSSGIWISLWLWVPLTHTCASSCGDLEQTVAFQGTPQSTMGNRKLLGVGGRKEGG